MQSGIEQTGVMDLVAHDPQTDEVVLAMYEERPWSGDETQRFELQEKLNTYLSFALDGEMAESFPTLLGKPIRIQLNTLHPPDTATFNLIDQVKKALPPQFTFAICIPDPNSPKDCDSGTCGCH
jgi:hypothetical protein